MWGTLESGASSEGHLSSYNGGMLFFPPLSSKAWRTLVENVGKALKCLRRKKGKGEGGQPGLEHRALTWKPPFMVSPNQTCFFSLPLLLHQFFLGTVAGLG